MNLMLELVAHVACAIANLKQDAMHHFKEEFFDLNSTAAQRNDSNILIKRMQIL